MKNTSTIKLNKLLNKPISISEKFHQQTKLKSFSEPSINKWPKDWTKVHFKAYSRLENINLPKPYLSSQQSLRQSLIKRQSIRKFSGQPISLEGLSSLLYYSGGIKKIKKNWLANRFYPSAGARYPLEIYILALKVNNLHRGFYHYYVKQHSLEKLLLIDNINLSRYFSNYGFAKASCFILISAVFKRTQIKYADRGYRFILLEAGHLGQNIYLVSTALGLKCCAIGGFIDDRLNQLLDLDGAGESIIYAFSLGKS